MLELAGRAAFGRVGGGVGPAIDARGPQVVTCEIIEAVGHPEMEALKASRIDRSIATVQSAVDPAGGKRDSALAAPPRDASRNVRSLARPLIPLFDRSFPRECPCGM